MNRARGKFQTSNESLSELCITTAKYQLVRPNQKVKQQYCPQTVSVFLRLSCKRENHDSLQRQKNMPAIATLTILNVYREILGQVLTCVVSPNFLCSKCKIHHYTVANIGAALVNIHQTCIRFFFMFLFEMNDLIPNFRCV